MAGSGPGEGGGDGGRGGARVAATMARYFSVMAMAFDRGSAMLTH
jgi:hypothetical protein